MTQLDVTKERLWKIQKVFKRKKLGKNFLVADLNTNFLSKFDQICSKYQKKSYYFGELVWFSTILNRTTSGIVLSEIVLSGDPLYIVFIKLHTKKNVIVRNTWMILIEDCERIVKIDFFGKYWMWKQVCWEMRPCDFITSFYFEY